MVDFLDHVSRERLAVGPGPADGPSYALPAVAKAFHFPDDPVEAFHPHGGLMAYLAGSYLVEVCGYLFFDVVRNLLILDEFLICLLEVFFRPGVCGGPDESKGPAADVSEADDLHLGAVEGKVSGGETSGADIFEPEDFFLLVTGRDEPGDYLLDNRDEPDKYAGVYYAEKGVQGRDAVRKGCDKGFAGSMVRRGERGSVRIGKTQMLDYMSEESEERIEEDEDPGDSEEVEKEMGARRPLCADIGYRGGDV